MLGAIIFFLIFICLVVLIIYVIRAISPNTPTKPTNFIYIDVEINKRYPYDFRKNPDCEIAFYKNKFFVYIGYNEENIPFSVFKSSLLKHYNVNRTSGKIIITSNPAIVKLKIPNPPIVDLKEKLKKEVITIKKNKDLKNDNLESYYDQLFSVSKKIKFLNSNFDDYFKLKIPLDELTVSAKKLKKDVNEIYDYFKDYTEISKSAHERILKRLK